MRPVRRRAKSALRGGARSACNHQPLRRALDAGSGAGGDQRRPAGCYAGDRLDAGRPDLRQDHREPRGRGSARDRLARRRSRVEREPSHCGVPGSQGRPYLCNRCGPARQRLRNRRRPPALGRQARVQRQQAARQPRRRRRPCHRGRQADRRIGLRLCRGAQAFRRFGSLAAACRDADVGLARHHGQPCLHDVDQQRVLLDRRG